MPATPERPAPRSQRRIVAIAAGFVLAAAIAGSILWAGERFGEPKIENVLIFLVDTLRADHLGCYGYERETSPFIDRFADESALFTRAYSVSPWTRTSVVSMFTALHPGAHGCQDEDDQISEELVMMAELFAQGGYRTRGFSSNINISPQFNAGQGFEELTYYERDPWFATRPGRIDPGYVPIEGMVPDLLGWLDSIGDQPFFAYFHSTDPHWHYLPPQEFSLWDRSPDIPEMDGPARRQQNIDRYDGEIRYTDHYFGQVIDYLRETGRLDDTLIVFTSDHGEELYDHRRQGHGHTLYNELLEVPLIVRHPSIPPGERTGVARLIDLLPTLIDLLGLEAPSDLPMQGRSLATSLLDHSDIPPAEPFVFAEVMYPSKIEGISYQEDGWKIIWTIQDEYGKRNHWELYHIAVDRREQNNRTDTDRERARSMSRNALQLQEILSAPVARTKEKELDPATYETLRQLGYVE